MKLRERATRLQLDWFIEIHQMWYHVLHLYSVLLADAFNVIQRDLQMMAINANTTAIG